ncbi:alpha-1D adrenergic receptor [Geothlypis trichas]
MFLSISPKALSSGGKPSSRKLRELVPAKLAITSQENSPSCQPPTPYRLILPYPSTPSNHVPFNLSQGSFFPSLKPSEIVFKIIFWLGYFNSCVNPIIYPCSSKEFKRAFIRLLKCQCRRRRRPIWRVYDHHWRGASINSSVQDSETDLRPRINTLNSSFIFNSSFQERGSKRRTLSFKGWKMLTPFQKPASTQLKEKMNSLSNKIRGGSSKGGATATYKTEVESVSIGIPHDFTETIDFQTHDLTDCCGLRETDI